MESWFSLPLRSVWEAEFTGRQELFSFGERWDDTSISERLASAFQSLFILANGFAQNRAARRLIMTLVLAKDPEWNAAIDKNLPVDFLREDANAGSSYVEPHWTNRPFFEVLDYIRAFRIANTNVKELLERSHPGRLFPEAQQFLDSLKEIQQWRLNFGYSTYRTRFFQVANVAAESFLRVERTLEAVTAREELSRELYELVRDWGAPQAASA